MPRLLNLRTRRELITALLLVALAFRALIPAGFMPASDRAFSLQICRAGFLASFDPHDQRLPPGRRSHFEHCPFGTAPAPGPIAEVAALRAGSLNPVAPAGDFVPLRLGVRLDPAHQPRAPPRLA